MKKLNLCFAIVASLLMASSCDDGTVVGTATTGAAGGPGGTTVSMGFGTGAGFQAGVIGIGVVNFAAGGSTSMTVNFVFSDGTLFRDLCSKIRKPFTCGGSICSGCSVLPW